MLPLERLALGERGLRVQGYVARSLPLAVQGVWVILPLVVVVVVAQGLCTVLVASVARELEGGVEAEEALAAMVVRRRRPRPVVVEVAAVCLMGGLALARFPAEVVEGADLSAPAVTRPALYRPVTVALVRMEDLLPPYLTGRQAP